MILTSGKVADFENHHTLCRGEPLPLGSSITPSGVNFAIFSKHATDVWLVLFTTGENDPLAEIKLDPNINRTGDIWHIRIDNLDKEVRYGYRMAADPNPNPDVLHFDPAQILVDPYAKALSGGSAWGERYVREGDDDLELKIRKRRSLIIDDEFDWSGDRQLNTPMEETIIYEMHVRGYTVDSSSGVSHPGTFIGLTEKIPYLKELGVTAIELLPTNEFEETDSDRINPETGEPLLNYWGYHPICFFAPKAAYASNGAFGMQVKEFKEMVKTFHCHGIEVIPDVVFNHTAEGDERGPTFCFRGIDNPIYYILDPFAGNYTNYSGCGNTLNCNHPVVRNMILDALRYWVIEMHVDGFRFDLASILGRGQDGSVLKNPPLLEQIAADPVLANTKLIAEAWDAAGLYQVGNFPSWGRWAEWNGKFRDDVRKFVKSDPGIVPSLAHRLLGSPDLYNPSGRTPYHSINFITSHDGFTMMDLVCYNEKHNLANGEDNRDGDNGNHSWNCGIEGTTNDPGIQAFRFRQIKNMASLLMLSDGVPMIVAGDEFGRTQKGNNNAYCQDSEISWIDWELAEKNDGLLRFFRYLIDFRKQHPLLRYKDYIRYDNPLIGVDFHGYELFQPDYSHESRTLALHIYFKRKERLENEKLSGIFLIANAHWEAHDYELPPLAFGEKWYEKINTALPSPYDIKAPHEVKPIAKQSHAHLEARSLMVLISF